MKRDFDLNDDLLKREISITVPLRTVVQLLGLELGGPAPQAPRAAYVALPAIGEAFEGGIYAGLTLRHNVPMALVLLPGDEELSWSKANDWAKAQGGELPSRADALMLWQNLPKQFKETYYWTSEEYAGNADGAWIATVGYGSQNWGRKSDDYRCRAVRRVAI